MDTRLRTVADGRLDAVVLARAGLLRLGREDEASEVLDPLLMLPAPGQGALAVECREPRRPTAGPRSWPPSLDDPATRAAVTAERRVLAALEAGCAAPLGALAEVVDGDDGAELSVRAVVAAVDGSVSLRRSLTGPVDDPEALGNALAALLVEDGAAALTTRRSSTDSPTAIDPAETAPETAPRRRRPRPAPRPAPPEKVTSEFPRTRDAAARTGPVGEVAFVGAGPGDEGLLTLRAVDRLRAADVVITDQPGREALLASYCRADVEVLDASFGEDGQPLTRANRAKIVVKAARGGRQVVRLMDGDPVMFTGLAEEIAACRKEDVPFEVVPGVTSATAVPAYAGIPLTPAGVSGISVVHPHGGRVDWARYTAKDDTLVVFDRVEDVLTAAAACSPPGRTRRRLPPSRPPARRCASGPSASRSATSPRP